MEVIEIREPGDENALELFHQVAARVYKNDRVWAPGSEGMFTQRFQDSQGAGKAIWCRSLFWKAANL